MNGDLYFHYSFVAMIVLHYYRPCLTSATMTWVKQSRHRLHRLPIDGATSKFNAFELDDRIFILIPCISSEIY
jgi:hypothetical protein